MITDREIPDKIRSAIKKMSDPDQINNAISELNACHVAVYEACEVTRDLDLVVAHEIIMIVRENRSKLPTGNGRENTIKKTILSIKELSKEHLEYYS